MSIRAIPPLLACLIVTALAAAAGARPSSRVDAPNHPRTTGGARHSSEQDARTHAHTSRAQGVDNSQRIDINQISMVVTNTGSIAWDKTTGSAGLEFPKGSGKTAVFAAGPWLGAKVGGQVRVTVSEYSDEYGPGAMLPSGLPDDPTKAEYKV